jgi:flagellar hook-associated protein 3 FlgL
MRVTQFTQYNNYILNQQKTLSELTDVQTQISTGEKIQNMYEDPVVYTKYLQLNEEVNSFSQVKSSANFAQTFANETDTTLNDFVSTLGSFKTKLLSAANATNDDTSREAIVSELKGELAHLKDLSNTSIDGKYLFSGSKFSTKPIDDNYQYQGNDAKVKAFLGAGVEREYNIDGASLFLGRDNDYSKHISTNVVQYDKMKSNPQFVVRGSDGKLYIDKDLTKDASGNTHISNPDSDNVAVNEPVTGDSQIRMLSGVEDIDNGDGTYTDGTSHFYIKGKKPDGESFSEHIALGNSDSVNDLLDKIGQAYGNTSTSKVVDVSMNDMGEIQIKDVQSGKMLTDFYMVASDYYDDTKSIDDNLKDIVQNGKYMIEFQKSNFNSVKNLSSITANNKYFDNSVFKFGNVFKTEDTKRDALPSDTVYNVLGESGVRDSDGSIQDLDHLTLSGTSTDGTPVTINLSVDSTTTMQDLMDEIKNGFGDVDVSLENGELVIKDNTADATQTSSFSLNISAEDSAGNNLQMFQSKDSINFDKLYMDKNGNEIKGNVSQIQNDYKIYYKNGEKITEKNPDAQLYADNDTVIADTMGSSDTPQTFNITYKDVNGEFKRAKITLRDTPDADGHLSTFSVINDDGSETTYDIFDSQGNKSYAHDHIETTNELDTQTCTVCQQDTLHKGVTYQQLGDVVSMLTSGNLPAGSSAEDYNSAINSAKTEVSSGLDDKGRLFVKDLSNSSTKIDLSISDSDTNNNSLYFQANNAVTVDEPQVDFFDTLQKAIDAVADGNNYADSNATDPRNSGIQGAIEAIDHVTDHVRRSHAKIGAVSNEFGLTIERTDMLTLNVQQLQSDNIDTDIGEASMKLNSLQTSYQALLASIAKVNNLTLLNYM